MPASNLDVERTRELVAEFGWNSTAYQILNPGLEYWHAPNGRAVVGLVRQPRRWVVAGAPVCAADDLAETVELFERDAADEGCGVCYVCAMDRLRETLMPAGRHSLLSVGAQPVWNPNHWSTIVSNRPSRNKGVTIDPVSPERASTDAGLRRCLDEWLAARPMPAMRFLVEPNALDGELTGRRIYVAYRNEQPIGFLLASPIATRDGFLFEQIIRGRGAVNGTAESLIDAAMRDLAASGATYVTQGLVLLSPEVDTLLRRNPFWLRALLSWARAHGNRFYNFRGLASFRAKMRPDGWEPIYVISNEKRVSLTSLDAIARAFLRRPPAVALLGVAARAVKQEVAWLMGRPKTAG